ncbi:MAG: hypothetical protein JNM84_15385 [Planctomycetes bacterium]|nr:hypothetical protein [Planctomycetota bacterium]
MSSSSQLAPFLSRALPAWLGALMLSLPALAQETPARPAASRERVSATCGLEPSNGAWLAFGSSYKCRFDADGLEFTPALGMKAPRNLPLALALVDIRRGERLLHVAAPHCAPRVLDRAVLYERGGVLERYDVRPEGLEQSFVFPERPAGSGDLVVRCRVRSELEPSWSADGALRFLFERQAGIEIGHVVGVDAEGRRTPGSLKLRDGWLELALPGELVDRAAYPLTLDPPIGTFFAVSGASDAIESDCAYDLASDSFLVPYVVRFSTNDTDLYGVRVSAATGALIGSAIAFETGVNSARRPRVAGIRATGRFLVVWTESDWVLGPRDILCAAVLASSGARSAILPIAQSNADEFDAVVAGDSTTSDDDAVVVWETSTGIDACQVSVPAAGNPTLQATVNLASGADFDHPTISKACSSTFLLIVGWDYSGNLSRDLALQLMDRNLLLIGPRLLLGSAVLDDQRPAVDGGMVVWERYSSSVANSARDILCATVSTSPSGLTLQTPATILDGDGSDEHSPDVARLGSRYCVVYCEGASALEDNAYAWLVDDDCTVCNARIDLDGPAAGAVRESGPRVASATDFDLARDHGLVSFSEALNVPPFTSAISALRVENQSAGFPPVDLGGGCGAGGTPSTNGAFAVGNATFTVSVAGLGPNAAVYFNLGFPSFGLPCGTCVLTNPLVFESASRAGSSYYKVLPIPCSPEFAGAVIETQFVTLSTASSACPVLPGVSMTNRLRWTLAY